MMPAKKNRRKLILLFFLLLALVIIPTPLVQRPIAQLEMARLRADLPAGLSRQEAYARIRKYGLVAMNPDYVRMRPLGPVEISASDGSWPSANQTIPPDPLNPHWKPNDVNPRHPWVDISHGMGSVVVCSYDTHLHVDFDSLDRISKISQWDGETCL